MLGVRPGLRDAGIDFRNWYGAGLSAHPAYAGLSRDPLPISADVAARLIGLPCFTDLAEADIDRVVAVLAR